MGGRVAFRLLEVLIPVFDSIESTRLRSEIGEGGKPGSCGVPSGCKYPLRVRRSSRGRGALFWGDGVDFCDEIWGCLV